MASKVKHLFVFSMNCVTTSNIVWVIAAEPILMFSKTRVIS